MQISMRKNKKSPFYVTYQKINTEWTTEPSLRYFLQIIYQRNNDFGLENIFNSVHMTQN